MRAMLAWQPLHQIPLISNHNPLLVYRSSPFAPNKQVEIKEGEGVEVPFLGPRTAADRFQNPYTVFRTKNVPQGDSKNKSALKSSPNLETLTSS